MERSPFLQLMRFVAAALVLCTHATFYYHERVSHALAIWHFGEVGVPIFFVISGIVMVTSSRGLSLDSAGAKQFILRRLIRIVPLWWLALGVKVAISLGRPDVVHHNHFDITDAIKSLFFIPYFDAQHTVTPFHGVGWTLLHEMQFYLLFSASLVFRLRPEWAASAVIVGLWVAGTQWSIDNPFWVVATSAHNLHFVLGMFVGALVMRNDIARIAPGVGTLALGAAVLAYLGFLDLKISRPDDIPIVLIFAAAALVFTGRALPAFFRPLSRLGDSSYSLYLFHPFIAPAVILGLARLWPGMQAWLLLMLAILLTTALAHALHLLVEIRIVRAAREHLLGKPGRAAQPHRPAG